jgi:DNA repair protein RadC
MPNLRVAVVREQSVRTRQHPHIPDSRALSGALDACIPPDAAREHFVMAMLDVRNHLIGVHTVGIGCLEGLMVHPREVFRVAVLAGAVSVGFGHNHPSGNPQPSDLDVDLTLRLCACAQVFGIRVLDHLIFGEGRCWVSLKSMGCVPDLAGLTAAEPVPLECSNLASKLQRRRSGARRTRTRSRRARREPATEPVRSTRRGEP